MLLLLGPAFAFILIGPLVIFLLILFFPVNIVLLLFWSVGYTLRWPLVFAAWIFIAAIKRPTDMRRNVTSAYRQAAGMSPWWFLT